MTILLFDHACLATGDRFCYLWWRVLACYVSDRDTLHVVFIISRGDTGLGVEDINGLKGT
jgi:hypothetical protein